LPHRGNGDIEPIRLGSSGPATAAKSRNRLAPGTGVCLFAKRLEEGVSLAKIENGENWAVIATLIENCKLSGLDPHDYLADVINRQRSPQ
jgi:IS66 C-terminal element